uniref:Uncharacterized protein n=2 Tax=Palpitomonas bilix TaxID=652834 RepID=A0A7S3GA27_9EUKA
MIRGVDPKLFKQFIRPVILALGTEDIEAIDDMDELVEDIAENVITRHDVKVETKEKMQADEAVRLLEVEELLSKAPTIGATAPGPAATGKEGQAATGATTAGGGASHDAVMMETAVIAYRVESLEKELSLVQNMMRETKASIEIMPLEIMKEMRKLLTAHQSALIQAEQTEVSKLRSVVDVFMAAKEVSKSDEEKARDEKRRQEKEEEEKKKEKEKEEEEEKKKKKKEEEEEEKKKKEKEEEAKKKEEKEEKGKEKEKEKQSKSVKDKAANKDQNGSKKGGDKLGTTLKK